MLKKLKQAKEEWGGTLSILDNWLDERQILVILYCKLAGLPPYQQEKRSLPEQAVITEFCQVLLDYASTGHFEIYEQIIEKSKLDGEENLKVAQELYSKINSTTDTALNFNDTYAENASDQTLLNFDRDLSELGQVMESRFEREDKLLEVVHLHHTFA
ncbi:sigma D regulator [Psychromonas sp. 14N.309.X.WAT.B.A12]|uniref:sigma D regulator n=1 Tax=unclassified Psychromonas TaxID=2614957 RepID=UPI0025B1810D|nr:sigma D regulator [Psychromonas sp. 14N.309.X.WAT.B.A12]MDN2663359.1 sigma D regulator [Psychromonas sp. 14N.309.X.WAT.B.A12]